MTSDNDEKSNKKANGKIDIHPMSEMHSTVIPFNFAKKHGVFIKEVKQDCVIIRHRPDCDYHIFVELRRKFNLPLTIEEISEQDFELQLAKAYESGEQAAQQVISDLEENLDIDDLIAGIPDPEDLLETQDDAPIIQLINALLTQAIKIKASDIHFEVFEQQLVVRFRIDGVLREKLRPPRALAPLIISRLKIMAKLDIAEKRLPQDGRITLKVAGRHIDVRVSSLPTHYGERIVLRLLDKQTAPLQLEILGMPEGLMTVWRKLISHPHGILLVTGPTGSGKTTTLYATLNEINEVSRNIMTIEDPIEYYLEGISQTQVNVKVDMNFSKGLRAILRQDPDIVMVGEIRDKETADMAVQSSLTGHLVFSTLHTNNAASAVTRLRDMGVEPFLVASTVIGVLAQRLVRKLCEKCKQSYHADVSECKFLNKDFTAPPTIYKAVGCESCSDTGYTGRLGLYELFVVDENIKRMIHDDVSENKLISKSKKNYYTLREDGCNKVLLGETTMDEILRISVEEL